LLFCGRQQGPGGGNSSAKAAHFAIRPVCAIRDNPAMNFLRCALVLAWAGCAAGALAQTGDKAVYKCPGNPVLYTDAITSQQAKERGCTPLEGAVTVIPAPKMRSGTMPTQASAPRPADAKVDPAEQRARDSDARRILETELKRDEAQLAAMTKEFNNGEPERLGNERNYQTYLDRVAQMKAALSRKESDVAALRRELAKLPP
jgi:hypothetical protein